MYAYDEPLIMYTLIPRVSGPFEEWATLLSEIKSMGFNTVYVPPLTQKGPSLSPFAVSDHKTIDDGLLIPGDKRGGLEQFMDVMIESELRWCFDLVLNHVAVDGKVAKEHPEWIKKDGNDNPVHAGYEDEGIRKEWSDLWLLDYDHRDPQIRQELYEHMLDYARFWFDLASTTNGIIRLDNLHSSNLEVVKRMLNDLRKELNMQRKRKRLCKL